jgi:hypothetical protein
MKAQTRRGQYLCTAMLLACASLPAALSAQHYQLDWAQDTVTRPVRYPVARFGKWLTLGATTTAATYGVLANRDADERYADLERLCRDQAERCARAPNGEFADRDLEREYQAVLRLDDRARLALIASQVTLVATVVLFIVDLPRGGSGEDIPYSPPRLLIGPDAQSRFTIGYRLRLRR